MTWLLSIVGVVMIVLALRDIFHTLWHPGGFGILSRLVFAGSWRVARLRLVASRAPHLAGPLGLVATLGTWAALVVVGFTLLYLPHMPEGFTFGSSVNQQASSDLVESLYLSTVALATLGLGDILPATPWLRALVPVEALVGFLLLTAGISWILQLYPALNRRRALARRLTTMSRTGAAGVVESGKASIAVQHLEGVRNELAGVELDLLQYGESYYFHERDPEISLPAALPCVVELIEAGKRSSALEVRQAAVMLDDGLSELLALVRREYLGHRRDVRGRDETLAAYARDHLQQHL
ncbi:potassium channel family protein [Nocardioides sp.]|uniref:potassium channel family protein n=1 Tax=Nocardioides sp. TaxID=35761 RepID=UPI002B27BCCE|nr:potassium channel family protein [Nocardioides sp.]